MTLRASAGFIAASLTAPFVARRVVKAALLVFRDGSVTIRSVSTAVGRSK